MAALLMGVSGGHKKTASGVGGSVWLCRSVQKDRARAAAIGFG